MAKFIAAVELCGKILSQKRISFDGPLLIIEEQTIMEGRYKFASDRIVTNTGKKNQITDGTRRGRAGNVKVSRVKLDLYPAIKKPRVRGTDGGSKKGTALI